MENCTHDCSTCSADCASRVEVPVEETCTHDCSTCSANCGSRQEPESLLFPPHELSSVKKVIGIVSGKGGVGKSLVTSMMAIAMSRKGNRVGILDADITGPSIPKIFGVKGGVGGSEYGMYPAKSKTGINMMSVNLLLENETDPVAWRGPLIAGVVQQFWSDTVWMDIDYMFVDMPPGTGDVPLTVFQSLPLDGIIIVTSPQELVSMIVEKAVNMAGLMNVPIIGLVENMSYLECPDCGKHIDVFGKSRAAEVAARYGIKLLSKIPVNPAIAMACDKGDLEGIDLPWVEGAAEALEELK
ncbi:MAG: Mrp/NBP35 family ATP-binding protein [Clostridiales bacterium]|nr:Mrp/NBP35 family ATP-binding protein [Clostridiales bacterium]